MLSLIAMTSCAGLALPSALSPLLRTAYAPPRSRAAALAPSAANDLFVNCVEGDDGASGSESSPLKTLAAALALRRANGGAAAGGATVHISGGMCTLDRALQISASDAGLSAAEPLVLRGDGRTTISGGFALSEGWEPIAWPGAAAKRVWRTSVSDWAHGDEIKMARIGATRLNRSRWPPITGDGLGSANFIFTQPWSNGTADPHGHRTLHALGIDPAVLPAGTDLASVAGLAFVDVLGCVERDVNSQLTRVLAVDAAWSSTPTLSIYFRNSFQVNQRFALENVPWGLAPGNFLHDPRDGTLTVWLPVGAPGPPGVVVPGPGMATLVEVDGAKHVVLSNLTFADTTYYADGYWDGPAQQPSDAAVRINRAVDVVVEASNFIAALGGGAVAIGNSTNDSAVVGCLVDGVGQGDFLLCTVTFYANLAHNLTRSP